MTGLVQIHPFPNGNGRDARIMADTVLTRVYGAKPIDWAGGPDLQSMNDRRTAYIAALKIADGEDFGPLDIMMRNVIANHLDRVEPETAVGVAVSPVPVGSTRAGTCVPTQARSRDKLKPSRVP